LKLSEEGGYIIVVSMRVSVDISWGINWSGQCKGCKGGAEDEGDLL